MSPPLTMPASAISAKTMSRKRLPNTRRSPLEADIRWHLIGHLQANKAQAALQTFCLIQTLDSVRLASVLHRLHPASPFPVLVEVNVAGEDRRAESLPKMPKRSSTPSVTRSK